MVQFRCASTVLVLSVGFSVVAKAQTEKTFPTDTEINLVLTQTERAIQQYSPLIDQEEVQLGKSGADTIAHDRQVVSGLEMAVKAFKGKPQGFNGLLGSHASNGWMTQVETLRYAQPAQQTKL
jgi:hypothetical protein